MATERENTRADYKWALASFFGEEQHDLLRLRDEAYDLLSYPDFVMNTNSFNVVVKDKANGDDADTIEGAENDVQIVRQRDHRASIDVPSALALAEHFEQTR